MSGSSKKVLDLFCGKGGATRGYQLAGHHVVGVDLLDSAGYIGDDYCQGDAVAYALAHAREFDFVHASPPCQGFSTCTPDVHRAKYPDLITPIRRILTDAGVPFVIENVIPAIKAAPMKRHLVLCGEMFGLRVIRHRVFEFGNIPALLSPTHLPHNPGGTKGAGRRSRGTYSAEGYYFGVYGSGADRGSIREWQDAMEIDWMTQRHELAESIPPAYTRYIGERV